MLQRPIDFDPFELTIEEKIFRNLKRLGAIFAAGAVTLGVLDMTNIRSVDRASEFLRDSLAPTSSSCPSTSAACRIVFALEFAASR